MRYRLRTLLIVLASAPPLLAGLWMAAVWLVSDRELLLVLGASLMIFLAFAAYAVGAFVVGAVAARVADAIFDGLSGKKQQHPPKSR